ncbi:MAG: prenyltransferase/squalene oxidase repeat-containing protein [Candidatus Odinarchaeota archaeon]
MKHKYRNFIIIIVLFLTINAIPSVLGKTRIVYLIDFIEHTEVTGEGFSNVINSDGGKDVVSYEATAYALNILHDLGSTAQDVNLLESNLEDDIEDMFDSSQVNTYDLYYLLTSLNILKYDIATSLSTRIYNYLNSTAQVTGGFSFSNTTHLASLSSTFYAIQLYSLINKPIANISIHKSWILSCNNTDGGYGGNQTLSSTYLDTSFAVFILDDERFGNVNDLVNINDTLTYLKSFYVNNSADIKNYGGFINDKLAGLAILSSTYYCSKAISLIDYSMLNVPETKTWVLARQNLEDGGFVDNYEGSTSTISSVISSYYAYKTLETLNSLPSLNNEFGMVEFNYWILIIVLSLIGIIFAIVVFLWKRRRI